MGFVVPEGAGNSEVDRRGIQEQGNGVISGHQSENGSEAQSQPDEKT